MKTNYVLLLLSFCLNLPLIAQESVIFTGRIVDESTGQGIAGLMVRLIGQGEDITDDEGLFRIAVLPNTEQVQIELPNGWAIQYPRNGQAPVLRSTSAHLDIEVKQLRSQNEALRREVARLQREKRLNEAQIDSLQQLVEDSLSTYRKRFQLSVYEFQDTARRAQAEAQALREKIAELTAGLETRFTEKNKAEIRGEISRELLAYLDDLKDLRDLLPDFRDVFLYQPAAEKFDQAVNAYNRSRAPIYEQHQGRLAQVALYWQNEVLQDDLEEVYQLILDQIHTKLVLPMNNDLIAYVKDAAAGRMSRVQAGRKAKKRAAEVYQAMAFPINELEQKIREVNTFLSR